ncbi:ABC transporter permease [Chryseobacterium sp. NEB161]|nr:ABC transporter permease [Chryseobacterium sp. NEB161]
MLTSSYPQLSVSTEKFSEIESFAVNNTWNDYKIRLMFGNNSVFTSNARVSDNFFEFFPFEKVAGSYKNVLNGKEKVAISEETARLLFAEDYNNCIGKTFYIDGSGKQTYVITAVYKLPKENP